jgi:hypothetical protein
MQTPLRHKVYRFRRENDRSDPLELIACFIVTAAACGYPESTVRLLVTHVESVIARCYTGNAHRTLDELDVEEGRLEAEENELALRRRIAGDSVTVEQLEHEATLNELEANTQLERAKLLRRQARTGTARASFHARLPAADGGARDVSRATKGATGAGLNWDVSREDAHHPQIAERAIADRKAHGMKVSRGAQVDIEMDLEATHANGCPLRLADLLAADDFNFWHDVSGIARHLDRTTGELHELLPAAIRSASEGADVSIAAQLGHGSDDRDHPRCSSPGRSPRACSRGDVPD